MPPYDIEKYRKHVASFGLAKEHEDELIQAVCDVMKNAVDRAFGDDPVQICQSSNSAKNALPAPVVINLESKEISRSTMNLTGAFNDKTRKDRQ